MAEDAFDRAALRHERLKQRDRGATAGRVVGVMVTGWTIALAVSALTFGVSGQVLSMMIPVFAVTAVVSGVLLATGVVEPSPLWHAGTVDGMRVQYAVMRGRAVRRPELAGLAVATAEQMRRLWWTGLPAAVFLVVITFQFDSPRRRSSGASRCWACSSVRAWSRPAATRAGLRPRIGRCWRLRRARGRARRSARGPERGRARGRRAGSGAAGTRWRRRWPRRPCR